MSQARKDSNDGSVRRWFLGAVRQYPVHSAAILALSLISSLADGLSVSLLIPFLTLLFDARDAAGLMDSRFTRGMLAVARWAGQGHEIVAISSIILLLVAFRCALSFADELLSNWISGKISCAIRSRIHRILLGVDYQYVCLQDNGRLLNTLDGEAWSATEAITTYFGLITSACMACVLSGLLLLISWKLAVLVAVLVGCVSLALLLFDRRARAIGAESVVASEDLSERAVELFDAMRVIRAFGRERRAQAAYDRASLRLFDLSMRSVRVNGGAR